MAKEIVFKRKSDKLEVHEPADIFSQIILSRVRWREIMACSGFDEDKKVNAVNEYMEFFEGQGESFYHAIPVS